MAAKSLFSFATQQLNEVITKSCIKLKPTYVEAQGPHCFGKVPFVTFRPANRENTGDIHRVSLSLFCFILYNKILRNVRWQMSGQQMSNRHMSPGALSFSIFGRDGMILPSLLWMDGRNETEKNQAAANSNRDLWKVPLSFKGHVILRMLLGCLILT